MKRPREDEALSTADFSPEQPQAFYLADDDMAALADATLVVAGTRLRVHSQVLSMHSAVLRRMFADLRGSAAGEPELEAPFQDATLFETALYLRLCYRPLELARPKLAGVLGSLPGLLQLAHKLDAPLIQAAVAGDMAELTSSATVPQLLEWAAAADHCQLPELCLRCLSAVARRLASKPSALAAAFADASVAVGACDKRLLAQLVGMLVAAGGEHMAALPAPDVAAAALEQSANHGSFEWALERFSQQPSAAGWRVYSSWFEAIGRTWRLTVCPGGYNAEHAKHLSVFLECQQAGFRAKFSITVVDQAAQAPAHKTQQDTHLFKAGVMDRGWFKFMPLADLRARPGYLAGDRLLLRVRVEVLP